LGFVWHLWRSLWVHFRLNSRVGGRAMRLPLENYSWKPIESAPLDEDFTLQVTDGHGKPYILVNASRGRLGEFGQGNATDGHAGEVEAILPRTPPPPSMTSRRFPSPWRTARR
jgi:hypothetical protein